jgi:hypothetical protein
MDKRQYIHPKEMEFISYLLNSKDDFEKSQRDWYLSKVKVRLEILQPLVNELSYKGTEFSTLSSDLNNEYNDLIFLRNKFKSEM